MHVPVRLPPLEGTEHDDATLLLVAHRLRDPPLDCEVGMTEHQAARAPGGDDCHLYPNGWCRTHEAYHVGDGTPGPARPEAPERSDFRQAAIMFREFAENVCGPDYQERRAEALAAATRMDSAADRGDSGGPRDARQTLEDAIESAGDPSGLKVRHISDRERAAIHNYALALRAELGRAPNEPVYAENLRTTTSCYCLDAGAVKLCDVCPLRARADAERPPQ